MLVITDSTPMHKLLPPKGLTRGLDLSRRGFSSGLAYGDSAKPFPQELMVPKTDWEPRIQEIQERKTSIRDLLKAEGIGPKNQANTNYCWIFGPTRAFEIRRVYQGQKYVSLSPASAGAQIKGYRNVGGWGKEGLQWIANKGLVPSERWPDTAWNNRNLATPENMEIAKKYRCQEWYELVPRNLEQLVSCLLNRIPVAVGYNWWGHEVCAVDVLWRNGTVVLLILNSWGNWGDEGYGIIEGNRMLPDDAVAPVTALAA